MKKLALYLAFAILCSLSMPAKANVTYSFYCITNNNTADATVGEAQMLVDVEDLGFDGTYNEVLFRFRNTGPEASSIMGVYFYDGSLLGISSLWDADDDYEGADNIYDGVDGHPGVDFEQGANPDHLPGLGGGVKLTDAFCADSDTPHPHKGVNPYEWLGVIFDLQSGKTYSNLISDLNSGEVLIGIHVGDFAGGGSESFVTIPAPGAILLGSIGVVMVGWLRRRRTL